MPMHTLVTCMFLFTFTLLWAGGNALRIRPLINVSCEYDCVISTLLWRFKGDGSSGNPSRFAQHKHTQPLPLISPGHFQLCVAYKTFIEMILGWGRNKIDCIFDGYVSNLLVCWYFMDDHPCSNYNCSHSDFPVFSIFLWAICRLTVADLRSICKIGYFNHNNCEIMLNLEIHEISW